MSDDLLADSVKCGHLLGVARADITRLQKIGDKLAEFVVSHVPCSCRREWVCHKCQTLKNWEVALHD